MEQHQIGFGGAIIAGQIGMHVAPAHIQQLAFGGVARLGLGLAVIGQAVDQQASPCHGGGCDGRAQHG